MISLSIATKHQRSEFKDAVLVGSRQLSEQEIRDLADALHRVARVRHELEFGRNLSAGNRENITSR
jgi:hypothetical protein